MEEVYQYLKNKLQNDDILVIGCSGGPDSMALLHILEKIKIKKNIKIICSHINHNTGRDGQKKEQNFVEKYCKRKGIIFETMTITNYSDDNFENEARSKRYEYFDLLMKKYNAKYLFTAHHGDDLIETILMRIVRGSSLKGYSGIKKESKRNDYYILRPLLEVTKDEIIKYNKENNIKYYVDSTNLEDVHTRNRYRKYILPKLKQEDKNVHKKFLKFSILLDEYSKYIDNKVKEVLPLIYFQNKLNIDELNKIDKFLSKRVVSYILETIYKDYLMLINDRHIDLIFDLINSSKPNSYIYLPNNLIVRRKYNILEFEKIKENDDEYEVEIIDYVKLPNNKKIQIIEDTKINNNFICRLSKEDVVFPLRVRNKKEGDKMYIKGLNGSKKISEIFINEKIPMEERNIWPIVVDSKDKIVWLPGLKKSKYDKPKDEKCDIILKYH